MRIASMKKITPEEAHCISVGSSDKLFTVGDKGSLLTHNSVAQQNIIFSCLLRPEKWVLLGIDLKRVELTRFRDYGVKVAVDVETAVEFLRFAQQVMMKRYSRMEESGVNDFQDLAVPGPALMVMIDEAGELLSPSGSKALSENTIIPTPNGQRILADIQQGDYVYDNLGNKTKVIRKYQPQAQQHFKMKISNDKTKQSETFIAGKEHLWVVSYKHPDGVIEGPFTMQTDDLHTLVSEQKKLPRNEQLQLKIRKGGLPMSA